MATGRFDKYRFSSSQLKVKQSQQTCSCSEKQLLKRLAKEYMFIVALCVTAATATNTEQNILFR